MSQKPTAPVSSEPSDSKPAGSAKVSTPASAKGEKTKGDGGAGAQSNLVTKSVAIGIGSAAIVAALMYIRRR